MTVTLRGGHGSWCFLAKEEMHQEIAGPGLAATLASVVCCGDAVRQSGNPSIEYEGFVDDRLVA